MRVALFFIRGGAVVVVLAALFSYLDDGSRRAAGEREPTISAATPKEAVPRRPRRSLPIGTVTIAAVGDIVMGTKPNLPAAGGSSLFSDVASELAADVVIGNLEGTLTTGSGSRCGEASRACHAFQTPPSYAGRLRDAGFTVLNLANDHSYDFGREGLQQTAAVLDARTLLHTGRPREIALQRVGGLTVAILGFAPYAWAQSLTDLGAARRLVRLADRSADVVIASMDAGSESDRSGRVPRGTEYYLGENRGNARAFAHAVVDAGADLVVGHGPRVLRGMEWHRGRLIAYSLGTFVRYKLDGSGGDAPVGGVLRVTLGGDGEFESGVLVPTRLSASGVPALDTSGQVHELVGALSRGDFGARAVRVSSSGGLS